MIVANPMGSWVEGARQGVQDAMALRHAADQSALANYELQRSRQSDPYNLQELQARARMAGIQADIEGKYADPMAAANLTTSQFKVPYEAAQLGIYGPLFQHIGANFGTRYDPSGAMTSLLPNREGEPMPFDQGMGDVMNAARARMAAQGYHWNELDELARQRLLEKTQKDSGMLSPQSSGGLNLGIPPAPATSNAPPVVAPTGGFETKGGSELSPLVSHVANTYNLPQQVPQSQQTDPFKYYYGSHQLPNAYYNQGATLPPSPFNYGIAHRPHRPPAF